MVFRHSQLTCLDSETEGISDMSLSWLSILRCQALTLPELAVYVLLMAKKGQFGSSRLKTRTYSLVVLFFTRVLQMTTQGVSSSSVSSIKSMVMQQSRRLLTCIDISEIMPASSGFFDDHCHEKKHFPQHMSRMNDLDRHIQVGLKIESMTQSRQPPSRRTNSVSSGTLEITFQGNFERNLCLSL